MYNNEEDPNDKYEDGAIAIFWLLWIILTLSGCFFFCRARYSNQRERRNIKESLYKLKDKVRAMENRNVADSFR